MKAPSSRAYPIAEAISPEALEQQVQALADAKALLSLPSE